MDPIHETIISQDGYQLNIKVLPSLEDKAKGSIIYYHGGGFLAGVPDDLPNAYLNILNKQYNIIIAPYRLAPEVNLQRIIKDACQSYDLTHQLYGDLPIFVFGRSAGAYLAFQIASVKEVSGIIDFYGYARIHVPQFLRSHAGYKKLTASITAQLIDTMIQPKPITSIPIQQRYILYLYARANGSWFKFLGVEHSTDSSYNLTPSQLKALPPTLIVHSNQDPDVPYSESKFIEQHITQTKHITIQSEEHDFDRTTSPSNEEIYNEVVHFLNNLSEVNDEY